MKVAAHWTASPPAGPLLHNCASPASPLFVQTSFRCTGVPGTTGTPLPSWLRKWAALVLEWIEGEAAALPALLADGEPAQHSPAQRPAIPSQSASDMGASSLSRAPGLDSSRAGALPRNPRCVRCHLALFGLTTPTAACPCPWVGVLLPSGDNPANGEASYSKEEAEEEGRQMATTRLQVRAGPAVPAALRSAAAASAAAAAAAAVRWEASLPDCCAPPLCSQKRGAEAASS